MYVCTLPHAVYFNSRTHSIKTSPTAEESKKLFLSPNVPL